MFGKIHFRKIKCRKTRIYFVAFLAIGFVFYGIQSDAFRPTIAFWKGTVAPAMLSLLAGQLGGGGSLDGTGDGAKFSEPLGVAVDSLGNIFITDKHSIRKSTPAGVVTTFAGIASQSGSADGVGSSAAFNFPNAIAVNSSDDIYVADTGNDLIRKITSAGVVTTLAGAARGQDGTGPAASFNNLAGNTFDSAGNMYVADRGNFTVRKITSAGVVTTMAGSAGLNGAIDATGSDARFYGPQAVVSDGVGNLYVSDDGGHTIRKITSAGVVTTVAGAPGVLGNTDATGSSARFNEPNGLAVNSSGDIFIADSANNLIRQMTSAGVVTTFAGARRGQDGTGTAADFYTPHGTATDSSGNVFVADAYNHTIRKITSAGVVTTFAGQVNVVGSTDGTGSAARFSYPVGLAIDSSDNLYVTDYDGHTIRKITPSAVVTTLAGLADTSGSSDGTGAAATFNRPSGISVDSSGDLYVADHFNHTIRKVTSSGVVTTFVGTAGLTGSTNGTGSAARFNCPRSLAINSSGDLFVSDMSNQTIRKVTTGGVVTLVAGAVGAAGTANGTSSAARFYNPQGVAVDAANNLYIADTGNHAIRKITPAGTVSTFAGTISLSGNSDGTSSAARFYNPAGISINNSGDLAVGDTENNMIRSVTSAAVVTTLAGMSKGGDGTGAGARFYRPYGLTFNTSGDLFVSDFYNQTIRKITSAGVVTTLAGKEAAQGSANGTGSAARFYYPGGIAADSGGNLYVADISNYTVRKITAAGVVTTLAGTAGAAGYANATSSAARFWGLDGVAVDSSDNIYVTENQNQTIRKITPAGVVTTFAGAPNGIDGTGAAARFYSPTSVFIDSAGDILVADKLNFKIRKVTPAGVVTTIAGSGQYGSSNGTSSAASFANPSAVVANTSGDNFVADTANQVIRKITAAGTVSTFSGVIGVSGSSNGTSTAANFYEPSGLVFDLAGNLIVVDRYNHAIRKVNSAGDVTTLAGAVGSYGFLDANGVTAKFRYPFGIAVNSSGDFFIADNGNTAVRKVTSTGDVTTLAGSGQVFGSADGTGSAAIFNFPYGLAVNSSGDVFVADSSNYTIRKVTQAGVVTTFAGAAGDWDSIDDNGIDARFGYVKDIAIDSVGNLFVVDSDHYTVRKITPSGDVSTFAGTVNSSGGADGTGTSASFDYFEGIAIDSADNIFIADSSNNTIRKITPAGDVTTFAGAMGVSGSADGTGSAARFSYPTGLAIDSADNIFVTDSDNGTIRKITQAGVVTTFAGTVDEFGYADGTGAAVKFRWFTRIAIDSSDNIYAADSSNNVIRKITPAGVSTTIVGNVDATGNKPGPMPGNLMYPVDVSIHGSQMYILANSGGAILKCPKP